MQLAGFSFDIFAHLSALLVPLQLEFLCVSQHHDFLLNRRRILVNRPVDNLVNVLLHVLRDPLNSVELLCFDQLLNSRLLFLFLLLVLLLVFLPFLALKVHCFLSSHIIVSFLHVLRVVPNHLGRLLLLQVFIHSSLDPCSHLLFVPVSLFPCFIKHRELLLFLEHLSILLIFRGVITFAVSDSISPLLHHLLMLLALHSLLNGDSVLVSLDPGIF